MSSFEFKKPVFPPAGVSGPKAEHTASFLRSWAVAAELEVTDRPFSAEVEGAGGVHNVLVSGPWGDGQPYQAALGDRIAEWARADVAPPTAPDPEGYRNASQVGQVGAIETVHLPEFPGTPDS